jgi:antitoxin CptB
MVVGLAPGGRLVYIVTGSDEKIMAEHLEIRRKRLRYRSWHRGTKELDLVLGAFADKHLDALAPGQLDAYEAILEADEHDIYGWLTGNRQVPEEHDNEVMTAILDFKLSDEIK